MQYVIMANGASSRWKNYLGIPKHLACVGNEMIIERTTRLLHELDPEALVVITAHDSRYDVPGARLYRPIREELEIDRFPPELLDQPTVFLYGDTFYTEQSLALICQERGSALHFYGSKTRIFAVRANVPDEMRRLLADLRSRIVSGEIIDCKGWQLYHRYLHMPLEGKEIAGEYTLIEDETTDFNTPEEYQMFIDGK